MASFLYCFKSEKTIFGRAISQEREMKQRIGNAITLKKANLQKIENK